DLLPACLCPSCRPDKLWKQPDGYVSTGRRLYGPNSQGGKARRLACRATHEIRNGLESQDREGAWSRTADLDLAACRRGDRVRRREFITLLGGAAAVWPLAAHAQQARVPTIGWLGGATPAAQSQWAIAFTQRLRMLGGSEGSTVVIEYRWAEGRPERFASWDDTHIKMSVYGVRVITT